MNNNMFSPSASSFRKSSNNNSISNLIPPPAIVSAPNTQHSHSEKKRIRANSPSSASFERADSRSSVFSPKSSRKSVFSSALSTAQYSISMNHVSTPTTNNNSFSRKSSISGPIGFNTIANHDQIRVLCRIRPLNLMEKSQYFGEECLEVSEDQMEVKITTPNGTYGPVMENFGFSKVFSSTCKQQDVFESAAIPLINNVFAGYNATIIAYGQTGSGKTYTMTGDASNSEAMGIIPRTAHALFEKTKELQDGISYTFTATFIEIYNETIRDLLDDKGKRTNLQLREDTNGEFFVNELSEVDILTSQDLLKVMTRGSKNRAVGATNMNEVSSRSHAVFTVTLEQQNCTKDVTLISKLVLVDLAGSEAVKKSGAEGGALRETSNINKSLSALGLVINALTTQGAKHIPYRNSVLTRLLKTSLGGNAKTALIVTCSPATSNASESLSTLRFGERAKSVVTRSVLNESRKNSTAGDAALLLEVASLREQLRVLSIRGDSLSGGTDELPSRDSIDEFAIVESLTCEVDSLTQVVRCKDELLRQAEQEREEQQAKQTQIDASNADLLRQLRDSIQVNNELVEKMAFIAELQQLDTLRGRLVDIIEIAKSPVKKTKRNGGATKTPRMSVGSVVTNSKTPDSCWQSVTSAPGTPFVASDSPYPSPVPSPSPVNARESMCPMNASKITHHIPFDKENSPQHNSPSKAATSKSPMKSPKRGLANLTTENITVPNSVLEEGADSKGYMGLKWRSFFTTTKPASTVSATSTHTNSTNSWVRMI